MLQFSKLRRLLFLQPLTGKFYLQHKR